MVIQSTSKGIYCPAGDFYIDPWRPVKRAVITHGHADHARSGMNHYLASHESAPILKSRIGQKISIQSVKFGESLKIGDAEISLHPAGHILGAAQIRVEVKGQVWVITGDFKRQTDPTANEFEVVPCHHLISECTFGLPIYNWPSPDSVADEICRWISSNTGIGKSSVIFSYSLGKAQRVMHMVRDLDFPIYVHQAVADMNKCYQQMSISLPQSQAVRRNDGKGTFNTPAIIIAPPALDDSKWLNQFGPAAKSMASGWMTIRGRRRMRALDSGFVISDHADWNGLVQTTLETGCESVYFTHGYCDAIIRWMTDKGIHAQALSTPFAREQDPDSDN